MVNTWDIFTAGAEWSHSIKDAHGRTTSLAATHFDVMQPLVSQRLFADGFRPAYPDGKTAAVCLSHDIDVLLKPVGERLKRSAAALKQRKPAKALVELKSAAYQQWDLAGLYNLEMQHNARSTFFFLSVLPGERDFNYPLSYVTADLAFLRQHGFEIGLHGNFHCATSSENALVEKKRLEHASQTPVTGYRNHYLCFDIRKSWRAWENAGLTHDSTFGFANMTGFRNGMCYPFRPFSAADNNYHTITELPLHVMDTTLFNYLKLDTQNAFDLVVRMFETAASVNGVLTLLWHNHFMHDSFGELYERLLSYFNAANAWLTSHGALVEWWNQKGYFEETERMLNHFRHDQ